MNLFICHDFIFFIRYFDTFNAVMFITVLAFQQFVVRFFEIFFTPCAYLYVIIIGHPYRIIFTFCPWFFFTLHNLATLVLFILCLL